MNKDLSYVDGLSGESGLLAALATFVNKYFKPAAEIKPCHIVVTPGASNCLDSLLFSLCEPGDSVMVLAPYWSMPISLVTIKHRELIFR